MIGVVADDTTGANDIGLMFNNNQYAVKVVTFEKDEQPSADRADVLIIDTDSRLDSYQLSYDKVYEATKQLEQLGCTHYFNKTCSVFRGNIGAELDAMMDALQEEFAVVSLAFPKNGRQTLHGIHTVHGKRLEESAFAHDPVHPTMESDIVKVLQQQTKRKVELIPIETVRQGIEAVRQGIADVRQRAQYCIVDAEHQEDLDVIAGATYDLRVLCGSSAIGEELPKYWGSRDSVSPLAQRDLRDACGVLVVSGSLTPQTRSQTAYLIQQGIKHVVMDSRQFFDEHTRDMVTRETVQQVSRYIASGKDVLVMADNDVDVVTQTKQIGQQQGIDELSISKRISAVLAEVTGQVLEQTRFKRLVVAGGDTSGTVCRRLGIKGNYIVQEIETGLPSGLAIGPELLIVLKSGSFGTPEFLEHAIAHLKMVSERRADVDTQEG